MSLEMNEEWFECVHSNWAERYFTNQKVHELLDIFLDNLKNDPSILTMKKLTSTMYVAYESFKLWLGYYKDDKEINRKYKLIKDILEDRVVSWATTNKYNASFTIFNLKNNYGRRDKTEAVNVNIDTPEITDDQRKLIAKRILDETN
jgi:hypothetical protein